MSSILTADKFDQALERVRAMEIVEALSRAGDDVYVKMACKLFKTRRPTNEQLVIGKRAAIAWSFGATEDQLAKIVEGAPIQFESSVLQEVYMEFMQGCGA